MHFAMCFSDWTLQRDCTHDEGQ